MSNEDQPDNPNKAIREDIFTTLAIAALLCEDNAGVQHCAAKLAERAPGSLRKNTLLPLAQSRYAYDIIMESAVFPTEEKVIGQAHYDGDEYDIIAKWRTSFDYTVNEVVADVADILIQRGFMEGRVQVSIIHPVYRGRHADSIVLKDRARYCVTQPDGIQQEA